MLNRRQLLESAAASSFLLITNRRAFAQTTPTVYPGGYVVHSEPLPEGQPTFVTVREGRLEGMLAPDGIRYFRGIPYAKPPVGDLRFKPPVPPAAWTGTRKATQNPSAAMQLRDSLELQNVAFETETSEDCLTLSITAPSTPGPHSVYVFIHGGGNIGGYQLDSRVKGASFAKDNIVFVTIGYRLGALGFLELEKLVGPEYAGSGNNAIRDQIAALNWLRDNIAAFGGDPTQITIGGQSAGAFDVCTLLASPLSAGLYRGVISQSGGGGTVITKNEALTSADALAAALAEKGIRGRDILSAPADIFNNIGGFRAAAYVDGNVLNDKPNAAARAGINKGVSLLIGWNRDERADLGANASGPLFDSFKKLNPGLSDAQWKRRFGATQTFGAPSWTLADSHSEAGGAAYFYYWTWAPDSGQNAGFAFHGAEMSYVFDNVDALKARFIIPDAGIQARATAMHNLWANFVKTGIPSSPGLPEWPRWSIPSRHYLDIGDEFKIRELADGQIEIWRNQG